jgi:cytochrome c-type biogenesis protein CcmH
MEMRLMIRVQRLVQIALFLLALTLLLLIPHRGVSAQEPQPTPSDNDVNRVAKQLYCPVCENIPLDVCPTQACHEWRELIRQKIAAGWNDQQIKDYFALQYGDRVLNEPPRRGLNWLVYIAPPVFLIGGGVLLYTVLSRMRKPVSSAAAGSPAEAEIDGDPYIKQVEEELKKKL